MAVTRSEDIEGGPLRPEIAAYQRAPRQLAGQGADCGEEPKAVQIIDSMGASGAAFFVGLFILGATYGYADGLWSHVLGFAATGVLWGVSLALYLGAGAHFFEDHD